MSSYTADEMGADFGRIAAHNQVLAGQVQRFNALLDEGKSIVTAVATQWTGEAWTSYKVQQDKWDAAATDLNAVLAKINGALADTGQQMQARDKANAGLFH